MSTPTMDAGRFGYSSGMTPSESDANAAGTDRERDTLRKDMSYSPASESETRAKQRDPLPDTVDDEIDPNDVRVVPGTGGPDDTGDVDVDPSELNLPGRG